MIASCKVLKNYINFSFLNLSLKLKTSVCEICKKRNSVDIHHLQYQSNADNQNFIGYTPKNSLGNLLAVCQECHDDIHKRNSENIKIKTSRGNKLLEL